MLCTTCNDKPGRPMNKAACGMVSAFINFKSCFEHGEVKWFKKISKIALFKIGINHKAEHWCPGLVKILIL